MGLDRTQRGPAASKAALVTLACYALLCVVTPIAVASLSDTPPPYESCSMFNCLSDRSAGLLALVVYGPYALLAGIVLSLLLLAVMNAVSHGSPVLNGIIAGLPAIAMALVVTAGAVAIRTGPEKPEKPAPVVTQCVPISGGRGCPGG